MKMKPEHYLLSIDIDNGARMHCYLMCTDKRYVIEATDRMLDAIEKQGWRLRMPLVLSTTLSTSVDLVREIIGARSPEVKRLLREATDYHMSAWMEPRDSPEDVRLMALH